MTADRERLMVQAFLAGLLLGFIVAIFKLVLYRELWTVFNLLAEPLRTALFGLLVAWVLDERRRSAATA
jgi:hypothetical protein